MTWLFYPELWNPPKNELYNGHHLQAPPKPAQGPPILLGHPAGADIADTWAGGSCPSQDPGCWDRTGPTWSSTPRGDPDPWNGAQHPLEVGAHVLRLPVIVLSLSCD